LFCSLCIRVIEAPRGLFISFPTEKLSDGTHWDIAFPVDAETRNMIKQAVLAEYEKVVVRNDHKASAKIVTPEVFLSPRQIPPKKD